VLDPTSEDEAPQAEPATAAANGGVAAAITTAAVVEKPSLALPAGLRDDQLRLWEGTRDALFALPSAFTSRLVVQDVLATDLHAFASALGASIEVQVVAALNAQRDLWDPNGEWALHRWERQAQRFPDVVLRTAAPGKSPEPLMGIELKGWYVLAREGVPTFRFTTTAAVCAPMDLLVVVPWALDAGISGSPRIWDPYVVSARDAAIYRNYHWTNIRKTSSDASVTESKVSHHYPTKAELIADVPNYDGGGNFGRYARTKAMDDYLADIFGQQLAGIPLSAWLTFLKRFEEVPEE
jgi:hypothetical protein